MTVCCQLLLKTLKQRNERTPQGYNKDDVILVPLPVILIFFAQMFEILILTH